MNDEPKYQRFYRDGPPYFQDFEMIISQLFGKNSSKNQAVADAMVELMKDVNEQLAICHNMLGKTEALVEEARERKEPPEEIEKLVDICRDLQKLQTSLANSVKSSTSKIVDEIFPR